MNLIDGLLLIDKPEGFTSHDLVAKVRKTLGMRAIGHGGTLDPMASGLLVLLAGEGTKLSDYILNGDKGYVAKVKLGVQTDTLDRTGKILEQREASVDLAAIERVIQEVSGEVSLPVPMFSAVKINGKELYKSARREIEVEVPMRTMKFYDIKLVDYGSDWFSVEMKCSKGSFIRAWAKEVGQRLGTGGMLDSLRRTWSSPYSVQDATTLEELIQGQRKVIPLNQTLPDWPGLLVDGKDRTLLENGQISYKLRSRLKPYQAPFREGKSQGIKVLGQPERSLIALLTFRSDINDFGIERVFKG